MGCTTPSCQVAVLPVPPGASAPRKFGVTSSSGNVRLLQDWNYMDTGVTLEPRRWARPLIRRQDERRQGNHTKRRVPMAQEYARYQLNQGKMACLLQTRPRNRLQNSGDPAKTAVAYLPFDNHLHITEYERRARQNADETPFDTAEVRQDDPGHQRHKAEPVGMRNQLIQASNNRNSPPNLHFDENEPAKYTCDKCDGSFDKSGGLITSGRNVNAKFVAKPTRASVPLPAVQPEACLCRRVILPWQRTSTYRLPLRPNLSLRMRQQSLPSFKSCIAFPYGVLIIQGFPGTGKTFMLALIGLVFQMMGFCVVYGAPPIHQAVDPKLLGPFEDHGDFNVISGAYTDQERNYEDSFPSPSPRARLRLSMSQNLMRQGKWLCPSKLSYLYRESQKDIEEQKALSQGLIAFEDVPELEGPEVDMFAELRSRSTLRNAVAYGQDEDRPVLLYSLEWGSSEFKVPWVEAHSLSDALLELSSGRSKAFRMILGQPAEYLKDLNLTYGFIPTYNETRATPFQAAAQSISAALADPSFVPYTVPNQNIEEFIALGDSYTAAILSPSFTQILNKRISKGEMRCHPVTNSLTVNADWDRMVQDVFQPARPNFDNGHFVLSLEKSSCMTELSSRSRYNVAHIEGVLTLALANHLSGGYKGEEIKIITPYSAQRNLYRRALFHMRSQLPEASQPTVETIDSMQGREAKVIILDLTICDNDGSIGHGYAPAHCNESSGDKPMERMNAIGEMVGLRVPYLVEYMQWAACFQLLQKKPPQSRSVSKDPVLALWITNFLFFVRVKLSAVWPTKDKEIVQEQLTRILHTNSYLKANFSKQWMAEDAASNDHERELREALPQLAASLHDLLKPLVMAATTGDTPESVNGDAEADLIQRHAAVCVRCMLGQSARQLGVQALFIFITLLWACNIKCAPNTEFMDPPSQ
ncbi:hypothetical protein CDV55_106811 [Aspergillus turcosus]|nr:hypothetical protein CDV55_106811 [Aspergillus turcosus]